MTNAAFSLLQRNKCNDEVKVAVVVAQVDKGFDEQQFISRKKPNNPFRLWYSGGVLDFRAMIVSSNPIESRTAISSGSFVAITYDQSKASYPRLSPTLIAKI